MANVVNSTKLYMPDGDLAILSCPADDGSAVAFKIHKGLLSYHSLVFQGMLALPDVPGAMETYDGVPAVQLQDNAKDLEDFLIPLYDYGCVK